MFGQRALSIAFYAAMFLVAATCILNLDVSYQTISSSTIAAWVQAVGSISAVAGAALIASRNERIAQREAARFTASKTLILCNKLTHILKIYKRSAETILDLFLDSAYFVLKNPKNYEFEYRFRAINSLIIDDSDSYEMSGEDMELIPLSYSIVEIAFMFVKLNNTSVIGVDGSANDAPFEEALEELAVAQLRENLEKVVETCEWAIKSLTGNYVLPAREILRRPARGF